MSYVNLILWSQKLDLSAVKTLAKATWPEALSLPAAWLCGERSSAPQM